MNLPYLRFGNLAPSGLEIGQSHYKPPIVKLHIQKGGVGGTILLPFALLKKAREHLMFSKPLDESTMRMAIVFRASLRHFSLFT